MHPPTEPDPFKGAVAAGLGVDDPAATMMEAAAAAAVATATFVTSSQPSDAPAYPDESQGECRLMGPFSLLIQAALGALALLSLVYKRWRERPQRPVKIWFFDASKQVFGSVLVHIANIFMSMLTSGRFSIKAEPAARFMARDGGDDGYIPNPCSFYLLNLAIDTTIGIPILIILLKITTGLVAYTPLGRPRESIQSGYYGNPPNALWWLKQSLIYFVGLFGMKLCVLAIFLILPWISHVGDWFLGWTEGDEKLQIAFVMMIFPLVMNAMQYYIIDSFIKKADHPDHERLPSEDPDDGPQLRQGPDDEEGQELLTSSEDEDDDDAPKKPRPGHTMSASDVAPGAEYDPQRDGDAGTVVGSNSSRDNHHPHPDSDQSRKG